MLPPPAPPDASADDQPIPVSPAIPPSWRQPPKPAMLPHSALRSPAFYPILSHLQLRHDCCGRHLLTVLHQQGSGPALIQVNQGCVRVRWAGGNRRSLTESCRACRCTCNAGRQAGRQAGWQRLQHTVAQGPCNKTQPHSSHPARPTCCIGRQAVDQRMAGNVVKHAGAAQLQRVTRGRANGGEGKQWGRWGCKICAPSVDQAGT